MPEDNTIGLTERLNAMQSWQQGHEVTSNTRHKENLQRMQMMDERWMGMNETMIGIKKALEGHTTMLEQIKPILQAAAGGKILYKVFTVIGSIAIAWVAIKESLHL